MMTFRIKVNHDIIDYLKYFSSCFPAVGMTGPSFLHNITKNNEYIYLFLKRI